MITYTRNLPHYHPNEATFFITFRLYDSISFLKLKELKSEFEIRKKELFYIYGTDKDYKSRLYSLQKLHFLKYDNLLDSATYGPQWLKEDSVAEIVSNKMFEFDVLKYKLIVYCIMPNHVHLVFKPNENLKIAETNIAGKTKDYIVADIMRLLKGSTARDSNLLLNRSGCFWHHESYDHVVRNEKELNNIIMYVFNNPVKAGLVENWKDWKWSYCMYNI